MTRSYRKSPALEAKRYALAAEMYEMHRGGLPIKKVAAHYGVTAPAIVRRLKKCGFRIFKVSERDGGAGLAVARRIEARIAAIEARSLEKWGCEHKQYKVLCNQRKPTRAYAAQRRNAANRGIGWKFNLYTWWTVWEKSGKWSQRGLSQGHYVMCRKGDIGPYAPENVYIALATHNSSVRPSKKSGLPTGVSKNNNRFVASKMVGGKNINLGSFATAAEAGDAYQAFVPYCETEAAGYSISLRNPIHDGFPVGGVA